MAQTKCGFVDSDKVSGADLLALYGPTLLVDVGFDRTYKPGSAGSPTPGVSAIRALVDTGASESCIDNLLGKTLSLPIIDRRPVAGVHGLGRVNIYLAQVHIPALRFTIYGAFAGVDLAAGGQVHQALIGRTFLRRFTMVYEGATGTVTLSSN